MEKAFLISQVKSKMRTYDNIQKISKCQDYYTTGCLLDYDYFYKHYKMIVMDFSK